MDKQDTSQNSLRILVIENIRKRRVSIRRIAKECGVNYTTLARWLNGKGMLHYNLYKIEDWLQQQGDKQ